MSKYSIAELDERVNGDKIISLPSALKEIEKYIIKNIDANFEVKKFHNWLDSSDEKPFRCNKNRYFWGN